MFSLVLCFASFLVRLLRLSQAFLSRGREALHSGAVWLADLSAPGAELSSQWDVYNLDARFYLDVLFVIVIGLLLVGAFAVGRWSARLGVPAPARRPGEHMTLDGAVPALSPPPRAPPLRTLSPAPRKADDRGLQPIHPGRRLRRVAADPPSPGPWQGCPVPLRAAAPSAGGG